MTALEFPAVTRPKISIVIVTYGGWEWVSRALSAVIENTDPCYEMIIVDNASSDGTALRLVEEVGNARILRNSMNRGFGCASNQGADHAIGEALLFLNSDAFVHPGWLAPLLERLRDGSVAAVGARLLNTDGSLQEAGSLLFRNGYTQFYGFGDEPERPPYRFGREVDYVSAACLLVRRRDFFDAGGFDAVYAPAYFEDVDLCLALKSRGSKVVYEPRSVVTHVRGASSDKETGARYWSRNLLTFEQRWSHFLSLRPAFATAEDNPRATIAARDAGSTARVLVTLGGNRGPSRLDEEGRAVWLVRETAGIDPDARVTLLSSRPLDSKTTESLLESGIEVATPDDPEAWLRDRSFHYDVLVTAGAVAGELSPALLEETQPQAYRVVDATSVPLLPEAAGRPDPRRLRALEALAGADVVLAASVGDLERARAAAGAAACFLVPTPFESSPSSPGFADRHALVLFGGSRAGRDRAVGEALNHFLETVIPLIRFGNRDVEFAAILPANSEAEARLDREGVRVVSGEEARRLYDSARLLVAPFSRRPTDGSFLSDCAARGLPFLATPEAAASLPFENLPADGVAGDPSEMAKRALALIGDERRWSRLRSGLVRRFRRTAAARGCRGALERALARVGFAPAARGAGRNRPPAA